jgi:hypothetical protein
MDGMSMQIVEWRGRTLTFTVDNEGRLITTGAISAEVPLGNFKPRRYLRVLDTEKRHYLLVLTARAIVIHKPKRGNPEKLEIEGWVYPVFGLVEGILTGVIAASLMIGNPDELRHITEFIIRRVHRLIAHQAARDLNLGKQVAALPAQEDLSVAQLYLKLVGELVSRAWRVDGLT